MLVGQPTGDRDSGEGTDTEEHQCHRDPQFTEPSGAGHDRGEESEAGEGGRVHQRATFLVWAFAATARLPSGPTPIAYALLIGGPATVTAIAWWEIHRLRTRFGVRLRGG
ncbi:hypothetical protein K1Y78_25050 [Streptomyces sp. tea 10]|nr:hypothetical protein [Streptomyces sp. tea 10]